MSDETEKDQKDFDEAAREAMREVGRSQAVPLTLVGPPAPMTAGEHRERAASLLAELTFSTRGSAASEYVMATAALAHATLGGPVPELNEVRAEEIEQIAARRASAE